MKILFLHGWQSTRPAGGRAYSVSPDYPAPSEFHNERAHPVYGPGIQVTEVLWRVEARPNRPKLAKRKRLAQSLGFTDKDRHSFHQPIEVARYSARATPTTSRIRRQSGPSGKRSTLSTVKNSTTAVVGIVA